MTSKRLVTSFAFVLATIACGKVAPEEPTAEPNICGPNVCAECPSGLIGNADCVAGKWICACAPGPPKGDCAGDACDAGPGSLKPSDIWPDDATWLTAVDGTGRVQTEPAGSPCDAGDNRYDFMRESRQLAWTICDQSAGAFITAAGSRTVTAQEADLIDNAARGITRTTACGTGGHPMLLQVGSPHAPPANYFFDPSASCDPARTYAEGLDALFDALSKIARRIP